MKHIAIITFFHTESSLCLANYLGKQDVEVDCYILCDYLRDKGKQPGIDYHNAPKRLGTYPLEGKDYPDLLLTKGANVKYFLLRVFSLSPKFFWLYKIVVYHAMKKIRDKRYDAINLVGQWPWVEYMHRLLKDLNLVHSLHEVGSHMGNKPTHYIETLIRDNSKMIFYSAYMRDRFCRFDSNNRCQNAVIPFGRFETTFHSDSSFVMPLSLDLEKVTFLFYGFIKPYKGLDLLKQAYTQLSDISNRFNLIIAGAGDDSNLEFFKTQKNACVINRFLSDEEMSFLNRVSHVVLLPYKSASQSGIIPTSFMYGNPVIATKVGALPENINIGHNGLLVEPGDAEGFANAMRNLVENRSLLNKLSKGALSFGHGDKFDWNNIARETINYLL